MQKSVCNRIWLLYLQGRLSPVQLLALCKQLTTQCQDQLQDQPPHDQPSAAA